MCHTVNVIGHTEFFFLHKNCQKIWFEFHNTLSQITHRYTNKISMLYHRMCMNHLMIFFVIHTHLKERNNNSQFTIACLFACLLLISSFRFIYFTSSPNVSTVYWCIGVREFIIDVDVRCSAEIYFEGKKRCFIFGKKLEFWDQI